MLLLINDNMTVGEVQDRFNECFPYLKLEFYTKSHKKFQPSDNSSRIKENIRIGDIRKKHFNNVLEIKSWHSTAKVEKELYSIFGLNAQVFRWDAKQRWVQTTLSDSLTLEQQNQVAFDLIANLNLMDL